MSQAHQPLLPEEAGQFSTSEERLRELSMYSELRGIVAGNPSAPANLLEIFSEDQDVQVRQAVAGNPNAPWRTLQRLAREFPHVFLHNPAGPLQMVAHSEQISIYDEFWNAVLRATVIPPLWWNWLQSHPYLNTSQAVCLHVQYAGEAASFTGTPQEVDEDTLLTLAELLSVAVHQGIPLPALASKNLAGQSAGMDEHIVREHFQWLAQHTSHYIREMVALNPHMPRELLLILAQDQDWSVRMAVASNPQTPPEILQTLAHDQEANVRAYVASHEQTPGEVLQTLAHDHDWAVRSNAASNPQTPWEALRTLHQDQDARVRSVVASHRLMPVEILSTLARDHDANVRSAVARNERTPGEVLQTLAQDEAWYVCMYVAERAQTPGETLQALAHDQDEQVRYAVAANPLTSIEVLETLAHDPEAEVRSAVAAHKRTPVEVLEALARDREIMVRKAVAWNTQTSMETLRTLAQDQEAAVRRSVARNERTSTEVLAALARDQEITVRWLANLVQWLLDEIEEPLDKQELSEKLSLLLLDNINGDRVVEVPIGQQLEWVAELELPDSMRQVILTTLVALWDIPSVLRAFEVFNMSSAEIRRTKREDHRRILANFMPGEALQKLAASPSWEVRYLVALHAKTPLETKQALTQDGNRYVRAMAKASVAERP